VGILGLFKLFLMKIFMMCQRSKLKEYSLSGIIPVLVFCSLMTSCVASKKVIYFNDLKDFTGVVEIRQPAKYVNPKIESGDILAITLQTVVQNQTNTPITTNSTGTFNPLNGYLVDKNGYVELSLIGFVKVAGLTTAEAMEVIKQKAKDYYRDPVVNVRIANFDVTVLGDVGKPGKVNFTDEKVTILDAIAQSGDMNLTGKKENVLIVRTEGDQKVCARVNLNSSDVFQSPYFYLKQRDLIYVEPNRGKIQSSDNQLVRNLGILSSIISIISLALVFKSLK
jgi:polysaccharide biosynthesis/export protein